MFHFFQNCSRKHSVFHLKELLQDLPYLKKTLSTENIPSSFMCFEHMDNMWIDIMYKYKCTHEEQIEIQSHKPH